MQAYESATKARRRTPDAAKTERLSDSAIMTVLYKLEIGMKPPEISKDLNIPVQRIYNVQYRYQIVRNDDGTQWYESKCSS